MKGIHNPNARKLFSPWIDEGPLLAMCDGSWTLSLILLNEGKQSSGYSFYLAGESTVKGFLHPSVPGIHSTRFLSAWMCVNKSIHVFVWIFKTLVIKFLQGNFLVSTEVQKCLFRMLEFLLCFGEGKVWRMFWVCVWVDSGRNICVPKNILAS